MTDKATELRFEPPDSGFWELDPVHFPRPATRYWTEIHPAAFRRGTGEFARPSGMLIDALSRLSPTAARRATKLMSGVVRTVAG